MKMDYIENQNIVVAAENKGDTIQYIWQSTTSMEEEKKHSLEMTTTQMNLQNSWIGRIKKELIQTVVKSVRLKAAVLLGKEWYGCG